MYLTTLSGAWGYIEALFFISFKKNIKALVICFNEIEPCHTIITINNCDKISKLVDVDMVLHP